MPERIAYAREPNKLPVVLSADEVVRFLEAIPSLQSRNALTTVYAAGLRVSEVVLLKMADIDSQLVLRAALLAHQSKHFKWPQSNRQIGHKLAEDRVCVYIYIYLVIYGLSSAI